MRSLLVVRSIHGAPRPVALVVALLAGAGGGAGAAAEVPVHFSGFASLAATRGDDDTLGFRRDFTREHGSNDGDWRLDTDSLLGLQWNVEFSPVLDFTLQAVLKERTEQDLAESVEWAFLRLRPDERHELRLGRMGLDMFMLSDYRQVGYAIPWVRPQPDFYGIIPYYRFDGADYTWRNAFDEGAATLSLKVFGGFGDTYLPEGATGTGNSRVRIDLEPVWGGVLGLERDPWRARLSFTQAHPDSDPAIGRLRDALALVPESVWPEAAAYRDRLQLAGSTARYSTAGLGYDDGSWVLQGEIARIDADSDLVPQLDAGYLSAGRRLGAFTLTVSVAAVEPQDAPEQVPLPVGLPPGIAALLEPLRAGVETAFNDSRVDQRGLGVALRWDVAPRRALKLQWDHWRVEPEGLLLWTELGPEPSGARGINVVAVAFDMVF